MRSIVFIVLVLALLIAKPGSTEERYTNPDMEKAIAIIRTSEHATELVQAAIYICSVDWGGPEGLKVLIERLEDPEFLNKLNPNPPSKRIDSHRIRHVLEALGRKGTRDAENVLLRLAKNKAFMAVWDRRLELIHACGFIRRPSPELLAFLDGFMQPKDDLHYKYVSNTLARIATAESLAIIEKKGLSDAPEHGELGIFFTTNFVGIRIDPPVVQFYKRVLSSKSVKRQTTRNLIVQSLFEYRRDEWYPPGTAPRWGPPPWSQASTEVLRELVVIADMALKLDITPDTKEGVQKARGEIVRIIEQRRSGRE